MRPSSTFLLTALLAIAARPAAADCPNWIAGPLDNGQLPNGANGSVECILPYDTDGAGPLGETLFIAGSFTSVEGVPANGVAMRDPQTGRWQAMGQISSPFGFNTLAVFEGDIVVAGGGDNDVSDRDENILRWDGAVWKPMGGGTSTGGVNALHVHNGVLYAGGTFVLQYPAGPTVSNIAFWNPAHDDWEPPVGNLNSGVNSMLTFGSDLIVAGNFTTSGGVTTNGVAKYNGTSWSAMGAGLSGGGVSAIQVYNGVLYAGGNFNSSNGVTCGGFARFSGTNWLPAGTIFPGAVHTLGVHDGQLVLAGNFVHTAQNIEQYNGGAYSSIGGLGMSIFPYHVASSGGILYIGGAFTSVGATNASHLAQYDGVAWLPLGGGVAGQVRAFADFFGQLVVGGGFDMSAEPGQAAHNIITWDGARLRNLGTGMNNAVFALETFKYTGVLGAYTIIAGGQFTQAGGVAANRIAQWAVLPIINPSPAWQPLGAGFNNSVYAVERHANETYAGGTFTASGVTTINRVARYNQTTGFWEALGSGMNGTVYALRSFGGFLYAGGSFTTAGGVATGGLARWNGTSWSALAGSFSGLVYSLEVHDGALVIGGNFAGFGGSPNLTSWNGSSFVNPAPGGTNNEIYTLRSFAGRLHVGGAFSSVGAGVPAARIASYGAGDWQETSGGADDVVFALLDYGGELQAGGWFGNVRNGLLPSSRWARWSPTGAPWIATNPQYQTVAAGGTAQFTSQFQYGTNPVALQWLYYDVPLADGPRAHGSIVSGAHSTTLTIANVSGYDVGTYRLVVTSSCGADTSALARLDLPATTEVPAEVPLTTAFEAVAPNPTPGSSVLMFSLAHDADVRVRVHDVMGRLVRSIDLGRRAAGRNQAAWNARSEGDGGSGIPGSVRPGVYFLRLEVDGRSIGTRRVAVL